MAGAPKHARDSVSLAVVGVQFPNKRGPTRRFAIDLCAPGDPVDLVPEPKNPADPSAVMVLNKEGMQLGYLTAERCGWVGGKLASGAEVRAVFQAATAWGAIVRATFDGNMPDLPPDFEEPKEEEPDFYPDWIPPDE